MSATIDGSGWTARATVLAIRTPALPNIPSGTVGVTGTNAFSNYTLVTISVPAVVGTYQIGPSTIGNAAVDFIHHQLRFKVDERHSAGQRNNPARDADIHRRKRHVLVQPAAALRPSHRNESCDERRVQREVPIEAPASAPRHPQLTKTPFSLPRKHEDAKLEPNTS